MLNDPLYLGVPTTIADPESAPQNWLRDLATFHTLATGDRSSKRRASGISTLSGTTPDTFNLTIGHSDSKENLPYGTTRQNIRLDVSRIDANGKSVTASAYLVTVRPNAELFTEADVLTIQRTLATFVLLGRLTDTGDMTSSDDTAERLLSGEA